jgi:choline-glycine betaine transporter
MYTSLIFVSMSAGFGAGILCWKFTEPWRLAAQPGPTDGNARLRKMEMITGFCSIAGGFAGGFAAQYLLLWLG